MKKRFVLLDRDGTTIEHKHHLTDVNDVKLIPKVATAIKKLKKLGLGIIIMTNQSVIGRNLISLSELDRIHKKILHLLSAEGAHIDGIYFCPHIPEDNCKCRKPKTGLVERAAKKHKLDPKLSFVVGDSTADIELGKNIGATTILVRTGYGKKIEKEVNPNYVVDNIEAALPIIKSAISE